LLVARQFKRAVERVARQHPAQAELGRGTLESLIDCDGRAPAFTRLEVGFLW
jgi:hypothetical protein